MPNNAVTLLGALKERLLVVPDYQRPYAWQRRQLEDLWQDLDLLTDGAKHYTGTLVLKDLTAEVVTDVGDTLTECEVVDGQQRLTTCLILIDRLRRAFDTIDHELADQRADHLARSYGPVSVDGVRQGRLQLAEDLNEHWLGSVLGDGQQVKPKLTEGERRLAFAARYFDEQIAALVDGLDADDSVATLQRLQTRVTSGLRFLVYEVEPESHAGEIFETLNGRGRNLTELEKIKNYLLFLAGSLPPSRAEKLAIAINKAWSRIYEHLSRRGADEDTLLRSHWLATSNPLTRSWQGAVSVKESLSRQDYIHGSSRLTSAATTTGEDAEQLQDKLVAAVTDYISTLQQCAMFTSEFLDPGAQFESFGSHAAEARASSARQRRSGVVAVFRPLLFAARLAHGTDGAFYAELMNACERYSARVFVIGQKRSDAGQARLYRLAHDLYTGAERAAILDEINNLTWIHGDDDVVRAGLGPNENWYWRGGQKYFLYEYELSKARRESDVKDFETYAAGAVSARTTEHVLPQKPKWGAGEWDQFTQEEHAQLVNGIGNLVLTDDNSSYGRKPFTATKGKVGNGSACYADSRLVQERELALFDEWTPATIEQRRAAFVEWALRRWPITAPAATVEVDQASEPDSEDPDLAAADNSRTDDTE
jgi:hypothetical protein